MFWDLNYKHDYTLLTLVPDNKVVQSTTKDIPSVCTQITGQLGQWKQRPAVTLKGQAIEEPCCGHEFSLRLGLSWFTQLTLAPGFRRGSRSHILLGYLEPIANFMGRLRNTHCLGTAFCIRKDYFYLYMTEHLH